MTEKNRDFFQKIFEINFGSYIRSLPAGLPTGSVILTTSWYRLDIREGKAWYCERRIQYNQANLVLPHLSVITTMIRTFQGYAIINTY